MQTWKKVRIGDSAQLVYNKSVVQKRAIMGRAEGQPDSATGVATRVLD